MFCSYLTPSNSNSALTGQMNIDGFNVMWKIFLNHDSSCSELNMVNVRLIFLFGLIGSLHVIAIFNFQFLSDPFNLLKNFERKID
jgi:hypothetical protein